MIVEYDTKLDFNSVLIRPKRSSLESRSQVNLVRKFSPKYGTAFEGIPIIAANMATGTFDMLSALSKNRMYTAIAKHNNSFWRTGLPESLYHYGFYTIGMSSAEASDLLAFRKSLLPALGDHLKICIDIANGYTQRFASFVSDIRSANPDNVIVAGNVCTPEMVQELIIAGADFVKIGIGPGCFIPGTKVLTSRGLKNIEDIVVGDEVFTHTGLLKKVKNILTYTESKRVISVNGVKSTEHHEYYVIDRDKKHLVTEENLTEYAYWVEASNLRREKHLLISRTN